MFAVGDPVAVEIDAAQCSVFRSAIHSDECSDHGTTPAPTTFRRRVRSTGPTRATCKLFLWEKRAAGRPTAGTILFVHGSSMASQPTFDLQVPGRPDSSAMDYFAAQGFDTWCVDMEGYGRSDQGPRHRRADLRRRRRLRRRQRLHPEAAQHAARCWSTAFRRARCARRCSRSAIPSGSKRLALDAHVWTGEGSPTLAERRKKLPEFRRPSAARSTAPSCTRSSTATIPAPPTTT